jgi:hypothetical protein
MVAGHALQAQRSRWPMDNFVAIRAVAPKTSGCSNLGGNSEIELPRGNEGKSAIAQRCHRAAQ